jgi:hypothetical protein
VSFTIPDGWAQESIDRFDGVLIQTPERLMATVDFTERCFRVGYSVSGRADGPVEKPFGRGWKQSLVNAAVARLEEVSR